MPTPSRAARGFTLIELMAVVAISGILAVMAVAGVRRYLTNAKTAEARSALGAIGKGAAQALEREATTTGVLSAGTGGIVSRRLCLSATAAVPSDITKIAGRKYQSNNAPGQDFHKDDGATHTGFACVRFEMQNPQAFQYNYTSDSTSTTRGSAITATASGDINGDTGGAGCGGGGVYSGFQLTGVVQAQALTLAPSLAEVNPDE